jgi:hypothetical protein
VRFRIGAAPLLTMACHCTGCQRMTGSGFSLSAAIPADAFTVIQGEPVIGGLHGPTRHYFCAYCMSWMFTRPEGFDWFVNLRIPMLDDARGLAPFMETCTDEKLEGVGTDAPHSYASFPSAQEYQRLAEEYARLVGNNTA